MAYNKRRGGRYKKRYRGKVKKFYKVSRGGVRL